MRKLVGQWWKRKCESARGLDADRRRRYGEHAHEIKTLEGACRRTGGQNSISIYSQGGVWSVVEQGPLRDTDTMAGLILRKTRAAPRGRARAIDNRYRSDAPVH
jgi:hypothetical protein